MSAFPRHSTTCNRGSISLPILLRSAAFSHLGGRHSQEDASFCDDALGLYAVADAMGGAGTGRPAADLAIATLQKCHAAHDPGRDGLAAAVMAANAAIRERVDAATRYWQDRQPGPHVDMCWIGIGTTIVALRISEAAGTIVHVGDSRAYRWREGHFLKKAHDRSPPRRGRATIPSSARREDRRDPPEDHHPRPRL